MRYLKDPFLVISVLSILILFVLYLVQMTWGGEIRPDVVGTVTSVTIVNGQDGIVGYVNIETESGLRQVACGNFLVIDDLQKNVGKDVRIWLNPVTYAETVLRYEYISP
jgi:hypothetical protein